MKSSINRKVVLDKIYELQKDYELKSKEEKKQIDKELIFLGKLLENPRKKDRKNALLNKGRDMNIHDIEELMDLGVTQRTIAYKLKISVPQLQSFIRKHQRVKQRRNVG